MSESCLADIVRRRAGVAQRAATGVSIPARIWGDGIEICGDFAVRAWKELKHQKLEGVKLTNVSDDEMDPMFVLSIAQKVSREALRRLSVKYSIGLCDYAETGTKEMCCIAVIPVVAQAANEPQPSADDLI